MRLDAFNPYFPKDFEGDLVICVEMHLTHLFLRILKVMGGGMPSPGPG